MNEVGFMKKATGVIAAAVAVLTLIPAQEVRAQTSNTIFPEGWDRSVRDRMFMRLGVISVNTKADSGEARDMTGPVMTVNDLLAARTLVQNMPAGRSYGLQRFHWQAVFNALFLGPIGNPTDPSQSSIPEISSGIGLGTPPGIKAKVGEGSTVALSMGYWLTEDFSWMLEAFLLAKPIEVKIYGAGTNQNGSPVGLDGKHILSTKMLPPLAVLSRHFGSAQNRIRPYVGIGATYAVLYDAKTTNVYDNYVGGKTSVSLKNAFGVGPFVGLTGRLDDKWSLNFQVGQINLKTEAKLTTRNTFITGNSLVTNDYSSIMAGAAALGNGFANNLGEDFLSNFSRLVLDATSREDFGTYTRKQEQKLRNTIVNLSVGYSF